MLFSYRSSHLGRIDRRTFRVNPAGLIEAAIPEFARRFGGCAIFLIAPMGSVLVVRTKLVAGRWKAGDLWSDPFQAGIGRRLHEQTQFRHQPRIYRDLF